MWRQGGRDTGPLGVKTSVVGETVPEVDFGNGKGNAFGGRMGGRMYKFGWRDMRDLQVLI
jgi:hypothetical protein